MHETLIDLTDARLSAAIKSNFFDFFALLEPLPNVDFLHLPELIRWHTAIQHPLFQGVAITSAAPGDELRLIRESCEYFASNNTRVFCWWFRPNVDPTSWTLALQAHGFTPDNDPPGMAIILDDLRRPPLPAHVRIVQVTDSATLRVWCEVFGIGYELPPEMVGQFADLVIAMGLEGNLQHYLAYQDDIPVATASLWLAAGVAGIYNVATIPAARRQGIGAAITAAALDAARTSGYRAGTLQSSHAGFHMYQELGFRHLCDMDHYVWIQTPE